MMMFECLFCQRSFSQDSNGNIFLGSGRIISEGVFVGEEDETVYPYQDDVAGRFVCDQCLQRFDGTANTLLVVIDGVRHQIKFKDGVMRALDPRMAEEKIILLVMTDKIEESDEWVRIVQEGQRPFAIPKGRSLVSKANTIGLDYILGYTRHSFVCFVCRKENEEKWKEYFKEVM